MTPLDRLGERIHRHIPVSRNLAFRLVAWEAGVLELSAPLSAHQNDKGTFFAGSQAALFTLAGWALTTLETEQHHGRADVVAVDNELKYTAPLSGDMVIRTTVTDSYLDLFHDRLRRRGQARLELQAVGQEAGTGEPVSSWRGHYLARLMGDT